MRCSVTRFIVVALTVIIADSVSAMETANLDKLIGQQVDIAPWAYVWRADREVQEKPEAYFIPRRLDRIDKVYRTAFSEMPQQELKSKHYDMPELITPLLPKPKGKLLAGLLWTVTIADYRVELRWPDDVKDVPSPEAVEVRVYPTAFGWFGWCKDEVLSKPTVSADGRTWIYEHSCPVETPVVVGRSHRGGSATEMVAVFCEEAGTASAGKPAVPSIRLIAPGVGPWKRMDVEIEWGFRPGSEKADFEGKLESYVCEFGPVAALPGDSGTIVTSADGWKSQGASNGRRGVVLPLAYVPGDRPSLDAPTVMPALLYDTTSNPYVPSSRPTFDSRVTVWTKAGGFTFRPCDLEKGPILIPEHGVFITKAGSGISARQFVAELASKNLKSIRQQVREHREIGSWDELMREIRFSHCPAGTTAPPFPQVEDPAMQVQLSDARWTDAWRVASFQLKGKHMWGGLAFEVGRVAHDMDLAGLHAEADKVYEHFLKSPGAKSDGDYSDGAGALEWASGMRHDMGYDHDGTHASTGRVLFALAERYLLTGDKEWFERNRDRMRAAADWIIRQRREYMKDVPNRRDLLVDGLMPPCMLGDYALPSSDWRWYYSDNAFSVQALQRFADALTAFDPQEGKKYGDEAAAFRADLRRSFDREASLSPVRLGRDGVYHSFVPSSPYCRGLMLGLEFSSIQRPFSDVLTGALPLAEPYAAVDAKDVRMMDTLDIMEETGTSARVVQELEKARKEKGLSSDDAWFWNYYGISLPKASHNANIYLLQDDVPNFLRFWMTSYSAMIGADGRMWEWGQLGNYGDCTNPDNGTAGWFLENFRNLLVMEDGESLWIARATPRAWLEQGKKISVKNAPTHFGTLAYEIVSDVDNGKIAATVELPTRTAPKNVTVRFRHPKAMPIKSVMVNGKSWSDFDPAKETIRLHDLQGTAKIEAMY